MAAFYVIWAFFNFDVYFMAAATRTGRPTGSREHRVLRVKVFKQLCGNLKPCRADGPGEPQEGATTGHAVIVPSAPTAAIEYLEKRSR